VAQSACDCIWPGVGRSDRLGKNESGAMDITLDIMLAGLFHLGLPAREEALSTLKLVK